MGYVYKEIKELQNTYRVKENLGAFLIQIKVVKREWWFGPIKESWEPVNKYGHRYIPGIMGDSIGIFPTLEAAFEAINKFKSEPVYHYLKEDKGYNPKIPPRIKPPPPPPSKQFKK